MNPVNLTSSNNTSSTSLIVNGLPNVQGLGGAFLNNFTDTNASDWKLLNNYSWVYFNQTSNKAEFQACVDRRFRTESAQDWQLNNAFMQNFGAFGYISAYNMIGLTNVSANTTTLV